MKNTIPIFFAINEEYIDHCCTSIVSILENNRYLNISIYILTDYISLESKELLQEIENVFTCVTIQWEIIDSESFKQLKKKGGYITEHTLYRYAIADLFPNLDKALYLDADLVINGSIEPLWELDLEGYYCAGVDDIFIRRINYRKILELTEKDVYINAGVLLLNLKDLRKDKIQEKLLQHTSIYINRDRYQDQDAINCICKGKIKLIPNIYNFTTSETLHTPEMLSDIIIIHYTGSIKPWHQEYTWLVLKELYCKYNSSMDKIKNRLLSRWMERTIELFQLSQKTNDTELEEEADKLLNKIIDHCSLAVPITYENGLCGIGTGIEYLLQKKLVEGNSDEILHQIDSAIYSVIEQKSLTDLGLGKGVSGLAYYFYSRLCTREHFNTPTALKIKEYLFHLINWIAELLPDTNNRPVLCEVYLVLSLLHELNIPQAPIETLMRNSLSQITGY